MGRFVEACERIGLKVHPSKSMVMVLGGEEGVECEVCEDGMRLEYVPEFKYLGCVLDDSCTDEIECRRKVVSGRRVSGAIGYLVNARDLQLVGVLGSCKSHYSCLFLYTVVRQ